MVNPITYINIGICVIFGMIDDSDLSDIRRRIANGTVAQQGQFPFMVSIQDEGVGWCVGTLISSQWVLTAASCLEHSTTSNMRVVYGSIKVCPLCNNSFVEVDKFIRHKDYFKTQHDIGVIKLMKELKMSNNVKTIPLNNHQTVFPERTKGQLIGWGGDPIGHETRAYLKYANINIFTAKSCNSQMYEDEVDPSQHICAGLSEESKGACTTDTGAPLVVNGYQVGIFSWSIEPCYSPDVYTRVSAYIDWIRSETGIGENSQPRTKFKPKIRLKIEIKNTNA